MTDIKEGPEVDQVCLEDPEPEHSCEIYDYQEAYEACLDYFNGDNLAANTFLSKYALKNEYGDLLEKTPEEMHERIAREFARVEKEKYEGTDMEPLSFEEIFSYLDHFRYIIPQGSPMFGIGNDYKYISLSNCFFLEIPYDNYSSILQIDEQLVNISKRRGGVGIDLSRLRPTNHPVNNAAQTSTGIASWMQRYSNSIEEVGQSGRRGALMLTLDIHHPDIIIFSTIKSNTDKITGANVSVRLSKEFLDAVEKDDKYELRWPIDARERGKEPVVSKFVRAKDVWKTIIENAHGYAEPGILMWDNVLEQTPADCYARYASKGTNPCSELNLSELDSCRLLCLNLYSYVDGPFTDDASFNFEKFSEHAQVAQRLMDDLVDLESEKIEKILNKIIDDPEPEEVKRNEIKMWQKIKSNNDDGRRTGTGITALGDTLAALGIRYGSEESIKITEDIYRTLKLSVYKSSVDMAEELGAFKEWDPDKEKGHLFFERIREEDEELYEKMNTVGRRNVSLTTTAPTGSVSMMTQTTAGIEPLYQMLYVRRKKINPNDKNTRVDFCDENGVKWQEFEVCHPKIEVWKKITGNDDLAESPWSGATAEEIDWINRVKMQAAAQRHVCHSISATINLPEDVSVEEVAKIYEEAFRSGCKGLTVYRKGCRSGVIIDKQEENVKELSQVDNAPKRPKKLKCDVHHIKVTKRLDKPRTFDYLVIVGILNDKPYEVFVMENGSIPRNYKEGTITKVKRGQYKVELDGDKNEKYTIENVLDSTTEQEDSLTRLTSTGLRHGIDIAYIVQQLEKATGDMWSFSKAVARALKKYIKDGIKVTGESCPQCEFESLARMEGCIVCTCCGFSKCG